MKNKQTKIPTRENIAKEAQIFARCKINTKKKVNLKKKKTNVNNFSCTFVMHVCDNAVVYLCDHYARCKFCT